MVVFVFGGQFYLSQSEDTRRLAAVYTVCGCFWNSYWWTSDCRRVSSHCPCCGIGHFQSSWVVDTIFFLWYWSVHFLTEKTEWDVTRFADRVKNVRPRADGDNSTEDTRLAKFFTNPHFGDVDEPSTILDWHGRIMVWYLPGIFPPHRVVCIYLV